MKMKTIVINYLFIPICFLISCLSEDFNQKSKTIMEEITINKVFVQYTDFGILTPINVNCEQFEDFFKSNIKSQEISNKDTIRKIKLLFDNIEPIDSNYSKTVDTRARIELYKNGKIEIICVGRLTIFKNGSFYKTTEEIKTFINQLFE